MQDKNFKTSVKANAIGEDIVRLTRAIRHKKWPRKLKKAIRKLWNPTREGFVISTSIRPGKWNNKALRMVKVTCAKPLLGTVDVRLPYYRGGYKTICVCATTPKPAVLYYY